MSILGFLYTIRTIKKVKSAVEDAKKEIFKFDIIMEFSTAIALIEESKNLNRYGNQYIFLERYSRIKKILISIKESDFKPSRKDTSLLNGAIQQIREIESNLEENLNSPSDNRDISRINSILSDQIEKIHSMVTRLRIS